MEYTALEGKTYSLFAGSDNTSEYYDLITHLTNELSQLISPQFLLNQLNHIGGNKRSLRKWLNNDGAPYRRIIEKYNLAKFTSQLDNHLNGLNLRQRCDRTLSASEVQYHFYMIQIELANRINKAAFNGANIRIALLPHCLHDLSKECLAGPDGLDYMCKRCSKNCYIRYVSEMLRDHGIIPYIWMTASLRKMIKSLTMEFSTLGVFGIACIPEVASGIRRCMQHDLPVMGLPLNANRCIRWMGAFHENSIDLKRLGDILA